MKTSYVFAVALMLLAACTASYADPVPFGVLSAHHLVELGTMKTHPIEGNIFCPNTSDSEGRIPAAFGQTGELYNHEFVDALPNFEFQDDQKVPATTPEPGTLALMGTGILFMAALVRKQSRV